MLINLILYDHNTVKILKFYHLQYHHQLSTPTQLLKFLLQLCFMGLAASETSSLTLSEMPLHSFAWKSWPLLTAFTPSFKYHQQFSTSLPSLSLSNTRIYPSFRLLSYQIITRLLCRK